MTFTLRNGHALGTTVSAVFCALALTLAGAGCSSSSEPSNQSAASDDTMNESQTPTGSSPTSTPDKTTGSVAVTGAAKEFAEATGACGEQPTLTVKIGATPATDLIAEDICAGTGPVVAAGATVTAHYTGVGLNTGKTFDSSWLRGAPTQFPLDGVIAGWSQGIPGMKIGGRRLLVIPGALAYGANPPLRAGIERNETLVFVVDIVSSP